MEKLHSGFLALAILLLICFVVLVALHFFSFLQKRRLKNVWRWWLILAGLVLISTLICIEHSYTYIVPNGTAPTHKDVFSGTVLFSFVTLLGIGLTALGVFWAYKQLKMQEDRIDSYEDFYDAAIKLLKDNRSKFVHFSGSTLIPGHISFGDENYVTEEGLYFKALEERIKKFYTDSGGKKDSSQFILPKDYQLAYNKYLDKQYKNHGKGSDFDGTQASVDDKKNKMDHMQNGVIHNGSVRMMPPIKILVPNPEQAENEIIKEDDNPFLNNFYLSNGKTMIYAISISHEQADMINNDEEPVFVGFKTQKTSIINQFEERFKRQWNSLL